MWLGKITLLFFILYPVGLIDQQDSKNLIFTAKVIRIIDGDTLEVLHQNKPVKVRLAHIDCPENKGSQPFGQQAKKNLSDLCFEQMVVILGEKMDRNGRIIAVVVNKSKQIVNLELVKQGLAWHFKKYSHNPVYAKLELEARRNKVGLWQDPKAIPPWLWRKPKLRSAVIPSTKF